MRVWAFPGAFRQRLKAPTQLHHKGAEDCGVQLQAESICTRQFGVWGRGVFSFTRGLKAAFRPRLGSWPL
eukprot:6308729-Alexandrium_andersonii.AAC.1